MKRAREISLDIATIVVAVWAAWSATFYAGFIAIFFCQKVYAIFPATMVICYLAQVSFIIRPTMAMTFVAWFCSVATCAISIAGVVKDFVDPTEGGPGAWDWINNMSPSASAILAVFVIVQSFKIIRTRN